VNRRAPRTGLLSASDDTAKTPRTRPVMRLDGSTTIVRSRSSRPACEHPSNRASLHGTTSSAILVPHRRRCGKPMHGRQGRRRRGSVIVTRKTLVTIRAGSNCSPFSIQLKPRQEALQSRRRLQHACGALVFTTYRTRMRTIARTSHVTLKERLLIAGLAQEATLALAVTLSFVGQSANSGVEEI